MTWAGVSQALLCISFIVTEGLLLDSYQNQPSMVEFAIRKLGDSLAELMGAEEEIGELSPGWAENLSQDKRYEWQRAGKAITDEVLEEFRDLQAKEENRLFTRVSLSWGIRY